MLNTRIARAIRKAVVEFGVHPYDINDGLCDEFADRVQQIFPAIRVEATNLEDDLPGHVYIRYKGKFYDAEELGGVKNREDLPIFHRHLIQRESK